jgi:hypothetical protein
MAFEGQPRSKEELLQELNTQLEAAKAEAEEALRTEGTRSEGYEQIPKAKVEELEAQIRALENSDESSDNNPDTRMAA